MLQTYLIYCNFSTPPTPRPQFSIKTANGAKNWDGTLYYSNEYYADNSMWSVWNGVDEIFSNRGIGEEKERIYIRGLGNSKITGGDSSSVARTRGWVLNADEKISCYGPIGTLIDYKTKYPNGKNVTCSLAALFYDAKRLKLPPRIDFFPEKTSALEMTFYNSGIEKAPLFSQPSSDNSSVFMGLRSLYGIFAYCLELQSVSDMRICVYCEYNSFTDMYRGCSLIYVSKSAENGYDNNFFGSKNGDASIGDNAFLDTSGSHKGGATGEQTTLKVNGTYVKQWTMTYYYTSNPVVRDIYNVKDRPYLSW